MAPKRKNAEAAAAPAAAAPASVPATPASSAPTPAGLAAATAAPPPSAFGADVDAISYKRMLGQSGGNWAADLWEGYLERTSQPAMLIDAFLAFLATLGIIQFAYCIGFTSDPFNAFLSGFGATVAQFVLTMSLRTQTIPGAATEPPKVSPERAFAEYVVCTFIVQFFCINYIN